MFEEPEPNNRMVWDDLPPDEVIFGRSPVMQQVKRRLLRICRTTVPVLLQGEVGVGKHALSKLVHLRTAGGSGAYLHMNCAGLLGAEFIDPLRMAGWGRELARASESAPDEELGLATVFLDQVNELPPQHQQRLVRSLADWQERKQSRVPVNYDAVRIISSSTERVRHQVRQGRFRRDLYDLLAVVTIDVPPLRHRLEDLPILVEYLRKCCIHQFDVADIPFSNEFVVRLQQRSWPGNIQELRNYVCRSVVLGDGRFNLEAAVDKDEDVGKSGSSGADSATSTRSKQS